MNGFRITILVLLSLAVGLMFYAFVVLLPERQNQYQMYQKQLEINEYAKRQQEHDARMAALSSGAESPELAAARAAAEAEAKKNEADLNAAEENSVIASVKRRQEVEQAAVAAEETAAQADKPMTLGTVAAYLEDCSVILFTVTADTPVNPGLQIALRRADYIVGEATVDGRDEESGQYTAVLKQVTFGGAKDPAVEAKRIPQAGDEVIISPFMSSRDLRSFGDELPELEQQAQKMPEIEAVLTPIP